RARSKRRANRLLRARLVNIRLLGGLTGWRLRLLQNALERLLDLGEQVQRVEQRMLAGTGRSTVGRPGGNVEERQGHALVAQPVADQEDRGIDGITDEIGGHGRAPW